MRRQRIPFQLADVATTIGPHKTMKQTAPVTGERNQLLTSAQAEPISQTPRANRNLRVLPIRPSYRGRGRFNRYAPWGTAPCFLMFDAAALVFAAMTMGLPWGADVLLTAFVLATFAMRGLYRPALTQSALNTAPETILIVLSVFGVGSLIGLALDVIATPEVVLIGMFVAIVSVTVGRVVSAGVVFFARTKRLISHNVVILGAGKVGTDLVNTLRNEPKYGLNPVGYVDPNPSADIDMPWFNSTEDISGVIERLDAAAVIVAFSQINDSTLVPIIRACDRMSTEIFVVPRLFELLPVDSHNSDHIGTTSLVRLRRASHRSSAWRLKRLFDIVASSAGLLVFSPLLIAAALGSWKENGWPILFRQERVGLDGRRFDILKFQTMKPETDTESATNWSIGTDDRVGPIGRFLRRSSIDELPQLWNVLRGDMSLVGPRPERPHFVGQFSEEIEAYSDRHRVPSGLTGFAQVEGLRGDTSIKERARYDNAYVESWSLWTDVKILLRSVISVVTRRGS